jgi:predicted permease
VKLPVGVRRLLRLSDPDRDVGEELAHHFEQAIADLRAQGLSESQARQEAVRRFGDVLRYRRELAALERDNGRRRRRVRSVESAWEVLKHAVRSIMRARALSLAIILTLALGLGTNVMMYALVDRLLLSPPEHVREPERLRRVMIETYSETQRVRSADGILAGADVLDLQGARSIDGPAAWLEQRFTVGHGLAARELDGAAVTGNYFALLGTEPALGRFIMAADDAAGAVPVAVISYELWQTEFGGRAEVLGSTLDLGAAPYTIVGVAPPRTTSLRLRRVDVWLPARPALGDNIFERRNWYAFGAVARLRHDAVETSALAELTALHLRGRSEQVETGQYPRDARVLLAPLLEARGPAAGAEVRVAKWMVAVSMIVLLIAVVNVANLMLARAVRQGREVAVRLALGISRVRLVSQLLLEGVLLGLLGGAAALLLAWYTGAGLSAVLLPDVAWRELGWGADLLPLTLLLSCFAGLVAATAAALHASRGSPGGTLRAARNTGPTRSASRVRASLALAQAALSAILLIGAGLFVRSLDAVRAVDLGIALDDVLYINPIFRPGTTTADDRAALAQRIVDELPEHPRLLAAAVTATPPLLGSMNTDVRVPGMDHLPQAGEGEAWMQVVSAGYFRTLQIPAHPWARIRAGRLAQCPSGRSSSMKPRPARCGRGATRSASACSSRRMQNAPTSSASSATRGSGASTRAPHFSSTT